MWRHIFVRVIAFTLALTLALGPGSFAQVGNGGGVPDGTTAASIIDTAPSLSVRICQDRADACFDACYALSVCGLAIVPADVAFFAFRAAKFDAPPRDARPDRASAPEPHPPKVPPRA